MPEQSEKLVMTDVPDASLEAAMRVVIDSKYEKVLIEVQDKKKKTFRITAE